MNTEKLCKICQIIKPISLFHLRHKKPTNKCKQCYLEENELKEQGLRKCRKCKQIKTVNKEFPNYKSLDGYETNRKFCLICYREESHKQSKIYRQNNKEKVRQKHIQYISNNLETTMLGSARNRAKKDNLPFNLTKEDIIIPEFCPILGIKLFRKPGTGKSNGNSPVLDKIIPELGYVKGNVAVISNKANVLKNALTLETIEKIKQYILAYYPELGVDKPINKN